MPICSTRISAPNGAGDPIQQGAGVQVSSQPSNFTQGNVTATGTDTDVAINGNGFFVVQQNGVQTYTRAGNFEVGTDNLLETADGQQVMGYAATNGVVNTSAGLSTARPRGRNQQSRCRHQEHLHDHEPRRHRC